MQQQTKLKNYLLGSDIGSMNTFLVKFQNVVQFCKRLILESRLIEIPIFGKCIINLCNALHFMFIVYINLIIV